MMYSWDIPTIEEVENALKESKYTLKVCAKIKRISLDWDSSEFEKLICLELAGSAYNFIDYTLPYDVTIGAFDREIGEVIEVTVGIGFFITLISNGFIFEIKEDNQASIDELISMLSSICDYYRHNPQDTNYDILNSYILPLRHWLYHRLTNIKYKSERRVNTSMIEELFRCSKEDLIEMVRLSPNFHFQMNKDLSFIYIDEK